MPAQLPVWRVEVSFAGVAPGQQVARAPGVSDVVVTGPVLRCLVCGSFQPFLEALRGYEVVGFGSAPAFAGAAPPVPDPAADPGPRPGPGAAPGRGPRPGTCSGPGPDDA